MNTCGGMQNKDTNNGSVDNDRYAKEIDLLMNELMIKLEEFNGNISYVISYLDSKNRSSTVKPTQIQLNYLFNKFEILIKITKKVTNEAKEEIKSQNEIGQVPQQLFLICILLYYKNKNKKE
ncbi:hypothetical protein RFI_22717 [Reticulomyxa filosa]|uniref:Uncharacterized protein n=1 Tax=Reticulomyxa filosa TaxID=46433 RepID=X6MMI8_RETFI|nr:hypothetical protein RFI_22717 [Reticulomyxa filosa]|eukprot:ETO14652.1 hypothetical protein RFI_22717 [Reticulomyxa filosa]